jgi:hypothetical protein
MVGKKDYILLYFRFAYKSYVILRYPTVCPPCPCHVTGIPPLVTKILRNGTENLADSLALLRTKRSLDLDPRIV